MENTTTAGAVEMAREIVAKDYERFGDHSSAKAVRAGDEDEFSQMRCTLAAIIETTELAARHVETFNRWQGSNNLADARTKEWVSYSLRNNDHLKGPQP